MICLPIGPPLRLGRVARHDHRHLEQPGLRRRQRPAMVAAILAIWSAARTVVPASGRAGARARRSRQKGLVMQAGLHAEPP